MLLVSNTLNEKASPVLGVEVPSSSGYFWESVSSRREGEDAGGERSEAGKGCAKH